jgi:hypothetical protein
VEIDMPLTDDEITTIACSHCKYVHEGEYRITQFGSKSALVAFARECIERGAHSMTQSPAGWKLVPVEPTEAMIREVEEAARIGGIWNAASAYIAMVEAAPLPASPAADRAVSELSDKRLDALWYHRDCLDAINRGDLMAQLRVFARAVIAADRALARSTDAPSEPINMVLFCPACGVQHIDAPEIPDPHPSSTGEDDHDLWTNPPHRSHLCHGCGHVWRPADVPTNGVAAVKTKGKADSALAATTPAPACRAEPATDARAERTPTDYALEHAEYMAKAAEGLVDACGAQALAEQRRDEADEDDDHDALVDSARQHLGESMRRVRDGIYDFRKRRSPRSRYRWRKASMTTEDLKPCPVCGGNALVYDFKDGQTGH